MLPEGADAVVMVEHTHSWGQDRVEVSRSVAPGENVVEVGEEVREGEVVLEGGKRLGPAEIGALAGLGLTTVPVVRRPRVAVISTGEELVEASGSPRPGQVRDINSWSLGCAARAAGGEPIRMGILPDSLDLLVVSLKEALREADLVAISGGSSVGVEDLVGGAISAVGKVLVHGISMRPGKPTVIGVADGKALFGIPGHPASALTVFQVFASPLIRSLAGLPEERRARMARLARNLPSAPGRRDYQRVRLEQRGGEAWAVPILGKSAMISPLAKADGLVVIPEEREGLQEGEQVEVVLTGAWDGGLS